MAGMGSPEQTWLWDQTDYVEKRRLFLQSYHFSRKRSVADRLRRSLVRLRRLFGSRLRSVRKLPRCFVWFRLIRFDLRSFDRLGVIRRQPYHAYPYGRSQRQHGESTAGDSLVVE